MVDYECLTYPNGKRILGFGHFAGVVGAHNGLLAYGKRTGAFELKPAYLCKDLTKLNKHTQNCKCPP
jgi:saccharopine dehydrogenase (NAD+, L-lysine-forming)